MRQKLGTQLSIGFSLIVLITVTLVSFSANFLINDQFEKYVEMQQKDFSDGLADGLSSQFNATLGQWNLDYIHGFGMYALSDGYILKVYDANASIIWDAENHDMTYCHQVMNDIRLRMQEERPELQGDFITHHYELQQNGTLIGYVDISYYSPYYYNENAFRFVDSLNQILLVIGILSLISAIAAGILLARRIASPIAKTIDITRAVADGNYSVRFASKVKIKELNELTQAVNHMADMLARQDMLRKRLTTDIAHELRTPIANVSSHLEAMIEGLWEPTPDRLQNCYDELARITGIVSDLERLQQIENENLKLHREPVDLLALAVSVRSSFEKELAKKHLSCLIEGSASIVLGDRQRLHQVIFNLMSNAVKYSTENSEIKILVSDSPSAGILVIEDHGIGIAKEELPLIFERFYRTDRSRYRKTGGAGIGLAIVKAIVEAHNGSITAESEEGRGARFTITLPKYYPTIGQGRSSL